jgi:hypothetical protein
MPLPFPPPFGYPNNIWRAGQLVGCLLSTPLKYTNYCVKVQHCMRIPNTKIRQFMPTNGTRTYEETSCMYFVCNIRISVFMYVHNMVEEVDFDINHEITASPM